MKQSSHGVGERPEEAGHAGELAQPDERDLTPQPTERKHLGPRQVIGQAASDIARGLRDTDLHGTPTDVPGAGVAPEDSPGAEVPAGGGDKRRYADDQGGKPGKGGNQPTPERPGTPVAPGEESPSGGDSE